MRITMNTNKYDWIAEQDLKLAKAIKDNMKTAEDAMFIAELEAREGVALELFSFDSLLSIYKALLIGDLEVA
jgi:hypothetical protein